MGPTPLLNRRLSASLEAVDQFCLEARAALAEHGWSAQAFWVELLLREALTNAVLHGCGGDAARRVDAEIALAGRELRLLVRDDGDGFDWRGGLLRPAPTIEEDSGRGLTLMTSLAADITFNERGNAVAMTIPRRSQP